MRLLVSLFLCIFLCVEAQAQVFTKSQIANKNNAVITENGTGAITGEILNNLLNNIIYSYCGLGQASDCALPTGVVRNSLGFQPLNPSNNLSELTSKPVARSNLGLGALATQSAVDLSTQITGLLPGAFLGPGAAVENLGYLPMNPFSNLADLKSPAIARANLGLGTLALLNKSALLQDSVINYGASGNGSSVTGSITAGSNKLTVSSVTGFAVGNGVRILTGGPTTTVGQVSLASTTVIGTAGTTTYQYYICSLGYRGDYSACQTTSTSTGPDPIVYYGNTYYGSTQNYVQVSLSLGSNSSGWVVYRSINGGALNLWTIATGSVFKDQGLGWTSNGTITGSWIGPDWLPTSPPVASSNRWFTTTITTISGNILTLALPALQTVSSVEVDHDDTAAFLAAVEAPANANGANIGVPCGVYHISDSILIDHDYIGFTGNGMCSILAFYGSGYDFNFPHTDVHATQRGNFVDNMYIVDRDKSTGYVVYATNTYNIEFSNLQIDYAPYGFYFQNNNSITMSNIVGNSATRGWASIWMQFTSDSTNGGCCLFANNVYNHGLGVYGGGTTSIGGTEKIGYEFDGNFATSYSVGMATSDDEGLGWNFINDTGNPQSPYYLQFLYPSTEFSTSRGMNFQGPGGGGVGPTDIYWTDGTVTGSQNNSANVVEDASTGRIVFEGGKVGNAGCSGIQINGTQSSVIGVNIGNNSTTSAGGTSNTCDGIVIGTASRGTTITGNQIGDPFNVSQRYPVTLLSGADYFTVTGNSFYGNNTNCVNNGATTGTSRIIANNAGSC